MAIPDYSIQISCDKGGTFTDVHASWPSANDSSKREELVVKLLSQDPGNYEDAPREGVRRVLEKILGIEIPRGEKFTTEKIAWIRLSTTVATNALLERKGAKHALLITQGFKDLLVIGDQSRPDIFALNIQKPEVLYDRVVEVDERVTLIGYTSDPLREQREVRFSDDGKVERAYDNGQDKDIIQGTSGEAVKVLRKPDLTQVRKDLQQLYDDGIRVLAIVLLHSYTFPEHEQQIGSIAEEIGFSHVSLSSATMPMIRVVARGTSCTCDAYLTPVLREYIDSFFNGFDKSLREGVENAGEGKADMERTTKVEFMRSDGGLTDVKSFSGLHSILSGPAGGVVAVALTSWDSNRKTPVIGLDMGGTSTDVSRYAGEYDITFETVTAGITVQSPQLDINTVAAGGGSRLFFRNSLFSVGPESCGAHPGPACYRKGGELAVTDANLVLGRILPKYFPNIFGESENQPLDTEQSKEKMEGMRKEINQQIGQDLSLDEVAWGFIKVANETMSRPIRALTEAKGYSTANHILTCFGGAGGQHACSLASTLGIRTILLHRHSSILSAYGMSLSERVFERQEPSSTIYTKSTLSKLKDRLAVLTKEVRTELKKQGFEDDRIESDEYLNLRYDGTDTALMTKRPKEEEDDWDFEKAFVKSYKQEFGFLLQDKNIIVDDVRVRGIGKSFDSLGPSVFEELDSLESSKAATSKSCDNTSIYFETTGRVNAPVYKLADLQKGDIVEGPAIVLDDTQTIIIDPDAKATITSMHVVIEMPEKRKAEEVSN